MADRHEAFGTFRRKPLRDQSPGALTESERAHVEERMQAGVCPRFDALRKVVRLAEERGAALEQFRTTTVSLTQDLEAERALLNRVRRVIEQARQMPERYRGTTAVDFIHNILTGDDDIA